MASMEDFHIFSDLPPIEESNSAFVEQAQPYHQWLPQAKLGMPTFNAYMSSPPVDIDHSRLHPCPSTIGFVHPPYAHMPWNNQMQGASLWQASYSIQSTKSDEPSQWPLSITSQPQPSFTSPPPNSRENSMDDANARSHSWSPDSTAYENDEEFPLTPEGSSPAECWQYSGEASGTYVQAPLFQSPAISHASHQNEAEFRSGIKLEDVQSYPDSYLADHFNDSDEKAQRSCMWEAQEDVATVLVDSVVQMKTLSAAHSPFEHDAIFEDTPTEFDDNDSASDYAPKTRPQTLPQARPSKAAKSIKTSTRSRPKMKTRSKPSRVSKRTPIKETVTAEAMISLGGKNLCPHCQHQCANKSALNKHITTAHTRPFTCTFRRYGCTATFGSKNEWKRHVSSQHLVLGVWRCDLGNCYAQPSGEEGEELIFNDFNRKDLFMQHLRRMHPSPNSGSGDCSSKRASNDSLDKITQRCLMEIRAPPPRSVCGYCAADGQETVFEGVGAWEARMEHVGRHLESGHGEQKEWVEDDGLRTWMINEGLLQWHDEHGYWLTGPAYVNSKGK